MAFDYTNLYPDTSGNGGYTKSWNYTTVGDSIATVSASGYFNKVATRLGIGDNIVVAVVDAFDKTRTALVERATLFVTGISGGVVTTSGLVKGDVGLGNVDNTSDANKPVSTAQAAADTAVAANAANASNLTSGTLPSARLPATLVAGVAGSVQGSLQLNWGSGVATTTITSAANGGSPTIQTPNSAGTIAVSASSPLALNATTGNLTISMSPTFTGTATIGTISGTNTSGHSIGAASPGLGWGLYHAGTISATGGFAINWQTDATLTATANNNTLQAMRITATPIKGAFAGVVSHGLYIQGGGATPYDFGILVADTSPSQFGGKVVSVNPTAGIGYATGAGGTVTQATSKATGVTLNTASGAITMNAAALAAATIVSFVLTDTAIAATDVLILNHISGGTPGSYSLNARCAAGSATIDVRNNTAGSLSEAIVIQFALIKAVNA